MNKKVYHGVFWLLMVMCVVLVSLVQWHGITDLETTGVILYIGLGGFFVGLSLNKNRRTV